MVLPRGRYRPPGCRRQKGGRGKPLGSGGTASQRSGSARPVPWISMRACCSIRPTFRAGTTCRFASCSPISFKKPVVLQNDGNAAAYGEYWVEAEKHPHSLVMFTLGTGIGCGIVVDGTIIQGRHSQARECGHMIIEMENGRQCSCGAFGHLEGYASATALVKRAHEALDGDAKCSVLRSLNTTISPAGRFQRPRTPATLARRLMRETAHYLAVGAVTLMHTIDPDSFSSAEG